MYSGLPCLVPSSEDLTTIPTIPRMQQILLRLYPVGGEARRVLPEAYAASNVLDRGDWANVECLAAAQDNVIARMGLHNSIAGRLVIYRKFAPDAIYTAAEARQQVRLL